MAKYRYVYTTFWNDPRVVEEMTAEDKYFFLYLLTNESTTQIGIYQITKKQMAFDLGYSPESTNALLQRFTDHHKLIRYNAETREIAIKNWGKYNLTKGGKPIIDCIKKELSLVKDLSLIEYVGSSVEKDDIRQLYESYYDTSHDTCSEASENEESSNDEGSHDTSTIRGQKEKQTQKQTEKQNQKEKQTTDSEVGQSVSCSNDFAKLIEFTNQNITPVLPTIAQHLGYILDDFKDVDLILAALQNAVLNNARNKIKYAEGTLINWRKDMITTYQQLQLKTKEAQQDGSNQSNNSKGNGYTVELGF